MLWMGQKFISRNTRIVAAFRNRLRNTSAFADSIVKDFLLLQVVIVDVGSNDGTLLTGFKRNAMKPLGVEPTNIAKIAREENGINTIQDFFTEEVAKISCKNMGRQKSLRRRTSLRTWRRSAK